MIEELVNNPVLCETVPEEIEEMMRGSAGETAAE
jgi:hypothetical protein